MKKINLLLVEDEEFDVMRVRNTIKFYEKELYLKTVVSNGNAAIELLKNPKADYDVVILDYQIAGALRGESLIKKIKEIDNALQIIVITKMTIEITDFEFANALIRSGAFWYCTKFPSDIEDYIYQPTDFIMSIFNAYEKGRLERQSQTANKKLAQSVNELLDRKSIIGESGITRHIKNEIEKYAQSDLNVLISGASGTGKELVANNIHYKSQRKYEKFVAINCGSIPQELIESELFGYEKGAFTGAYAKKQGLFEIANNGTIFLDEVSELPRNAQVKLLRVLQEGEIEKIGRTGSVIINVRVIAATNKNLQEEISKDKFREDLFYRLNVVPIYLCPLKERKEDIPVLIMHFLNYYSNEMGIKVPSVEKKSLEILSEYEWPGNVRELKNLIQRLLLNNNNKISTSDVANSLNSMQPFPIALDSYEKIWAKGGLIPLRDFENEIREKYFMYVRSISKSDSEAAQKLGLARSNFYRMCKELGLK
jgi:DNA-binding NtrC family response regulator